MKSTLLFFLCIPLLLGSCFREAPAGRTHYRYGNKTDRIVRVLSYGVDDDNNPVYVEHSFELAPGEEYEISYARPMGEMAPPFSYSRYVRISDGEKEVLFYGFPTNPNHKTYIYEQRFYQIVKAKKYEIWYRYDFTAADFRDGVPIAKR